MTFRLIDRERAHHAVSWLCVVLGCHPPGLLGLEQAICQSAAAG
jgi:hypothetical protein